jgi:Flp pilus assembly protein TadD
MLAYLRHVGHPAHGIPVFRRCGIPLVLVLSLPSVAFCATRSSPLSASQICDSENATARRLVQAGRLSSALPLLQHAYAECPEDYENARDLAKAEIQAGQNDQARSVIAALLRQQDIAELHNLLGRVESAEKNYGAATIQYQIAAQMDPSEGNIFDFGTTLFQLNFDASATILRFGVKNYPKSGRMHVALGTALYALSIPEEGAREFCNAEELDPADPHPMELLAETATIPADLSSEVTDMLANLHKRYPRNGLLLFDYTMAKSGRWSSDKYSLPPGFVQSVRTAIHLDPRIPQAYYQLALVAADNKQYSEEIHLLQKAIALDPRKPDYYYRLAFAFRNAGNQEQYRIAIRQFQKIKSASSRQPAQP